MLGGTGRLEAWGVVEALELLRGDSGNLGTVLRGAVGVLSDGLVGVPLPFQPPLPSQACRESVEAPHWPNAQGVLGWGVGEELRSEAERLPGTQPHSGSQETGGGDIMRCQLGFWQVWL